MTLQLRCGDVVAGCEGVVSGGTQQEVLTAATTHAAEAHDLTAIDEATEQALIAAIHPV